MLVNFISVQVCYFVRRVLYRVVSVLMQLVLSVFQILEVCLFTLILSSSIVFDYYTCRPCSKIITPQRPAQLEMPIPRELYIRSGSSRLPKERPTRFYLRPDVCTCIVINSATIPMNHYSHGSRTSRLRSLLYISRTSFQAPLFHRHRRDIVGDPTIA